MLQHYFCWKVCTFSLNYLDMFVKNELTTYVWLISGFPILFHLSMSLLHHRPILQCLDCCSFLVSLEIRILFIFWCLYKWNHTVLFFIYFFCNINFEIYPHLVINLSIYPGDAYLQSLHFHNCIVFLCVSIP